MTYDNFAHTAFEMLYTLGVLLSLPCYSNFCAGIDNAAYKKEIRISQTLSPSAVAWCKVRQATVVTDPSKNSPLTRDEKIGIMPVFQGPHLLAVRKAVSPTANARFDSGWGCH